MTHPWLINTLGQVRRWTMNGDKYCVVYELDDGHIRTLCGCIRKLQGPILNLQAKKVQFRCRTCYNRQRSMHNHMRD